MVWLSSLPKRGSKTGVQVSFDPVISIQSQPKMYDVLNAQQWVALVNERAPIDNIQLLPEWSDPSALHSIDWQDEVYRSGLRQNYNIALRGGSEKVQTAFSAGYFDQEGIVLGSEFERFNLSLNLDYSPVSWLRSSSSVKYTRRNHKTHLGTGGQIGDSEAKGILDLSFLPPTMTGIRVLLTGLKTAWVIMASILLKVFIFFLLIMEILFMMPKPMK